MAEKILRGIRLGLVRASAQWQHRDAENTDHTRDLAEAVKAGAQMPPLDVVELDDGSAEYALVDGYHRLAAYRTSRVERVDLRVVAKGNESDAEWWACRANIGHGLRRSNDEKRNAVRAALRHARADGAKNDEIASWCGVSLSLVSDVRKEVERPAAREASNERVASVAAKMPRASVRDVAKAAGVSKSAAQRAMAKVSPSTESLEGDTRKPANPGGHAMPDPGPWDRIMAAITGLARSLHDDIDATGESTAQAIRKGLDVARDAAKASRPVECPKHTGPRCGICGGAGWCGSGRARDMVRS